MGKLRQLRKAIKKNPKDFFWIDWNGKIKVSGVWKYSKSPNFTGSSTCLGYHNFVRSVLYELGYKVPYRAPYRSHR